MMNLDDLPGALQGLVPAKPSSSGWGQKVRRRHRMRRIGAAIASGAIVVAAIALAALTWQPGPTVRATPVPADPATGTEQPVTDTPTPATPSDPVTESRTTNPVHPFTAADVERAWFDDAVLETLPSSIRDQISIVREGMQEAGQGYGAVEVELLWGMADVVGLDTRWTFDDGTLSSSMDYHRVLGNGQSETLFATVLFDRGLEQCVGHADEFIEDGRTRPTPPDGLLPATPDVVWLCFPGLLEAEPLENGLGMIATPRDALSAVDLFNALEDAADLCQEDERPAGFAVFQYADGTEYFVEVRAEGCVSVGEESRLGGADFHRALLALADN